MKKGYLLICFVSILFIQGFSQYKTGMVLDSLNKNGVRSNGFALFLPDNYNRLKTYGLAIFFDPGGQGKVPLKKYRSLAKKNNLILIGLNDSKNGPLEPNFRAFLDSWNWIVNRFLVDTKNVYLIGFSGGARTASYITQRVDFDFAGVIGCGAGFFTKEIPEYQFQFVGVAGNEDMNYYEMLTLNEKLLKIGWDTYFLTFDGGHTWMSENSLSRAFLKLKLSRFKKSKPNEENQFVSASYGNDLRKLEHEKKTWNQYMKIRELINFYDDLQDVKSLKIRLKKIKELEDVKNRLKNQELYESFFQKKIVELSLAFNVIKKENVGSHFKSDSKRWWVRKIQEIEKFGNSNEIEFVLMKKRLYGFLDVFPVEQGNRALLKGDFYLAIHYFKVCSIIRERAYLPELKIAEAFAKLNDKKNSIRHLKLAIKKGFFNRSLILKNECFNILHEENEFSKLIARLPSQL